MKCTELQPGDRILVVKSRMTAFEGRIATVHPEQKYKASIGVAYWFPDDAQLQAAIRKETGRDYWVGPWDYIEYPEGLNNRLEAFPWKKE